MRTVAFHTLGCKVNFYDTEAIWQLFKKDGYEQAPFDQRADVYVINTCTVTHVGDKKSRQMIRRAIRQNPEATVVVTGCYAQIAPDEVMGIPGVDLVIGTQHREQMMDLVHKVQTERKPYNFVGNIMQQRNFEELDVPYFMDRTRASLKIQEGCNNFCTFCIIPYSRGFLRSRKPENVIRQAKRLVEAGYYEIVLTGIHTGGYGADLPDYSLAKLLADLENVEGLHRIRISSIEASEIDDEAIEVLAKSKKICRHLHIPLQAGDNQVLKKMNRRYTTEQFAEKIQKLRQALPDLAITSDVIVGFPGESDEGFEATYRFISEQNFAQLHVFPYSKRRGTPAAKFQNQVPEDVKEHRVQRLIELSEQLMNEYAASFLGKTLEVIPEEFYDEEKTLVVGHADNYVKVIFPGGKEVLGQICEVKLDRVEKELAFGQMVRQVTFAKTEEDVSLEDQPLFDQHPVQFEAI
ncbi:tRNA (N(6)-L-threonylcarbamoyladenosine(37)-C(2))-methylthiotransferase MtaB [Fodinisporobacter ferrooxydans]|uniref:tRNA (N(6)-L-threonylcarbamoyladenosine(37)-C(2))-methylthiotransferase n=1 Tax=Fodinisporobacter ferrooxydans TaxID=2901836 RepID=A0ABY4CEH1_9BACL|nr:tRNA (N(6)-L-threonylcarbamoyladenosine(37)-C(2))-methylthiotransferase MtaB [Alicyclobacillaceae bacterium MYW30-H2]